MEPEQPTRRRQRKKPFPHHVSTYENQEGLDLLDQLTERRGLSIAALLRTLVREEAQRLKIQPEQTGAANLAKGIPSLAPV